MHLTEPQRYELIDRVAHEGEPELLFAPLEQPPPGLPAGWSEILRERDPQTATLWLWEPMAPQLPRVTQALREKLQGIALLRTEDVPQSLIYFFRDGAEIFAYRGFEPASSLPSTEDRGVHKLYAIHDGWISAYTRDDGPLPRARWDILSEQLWPDTQWKLPPGFTRVEALAAVYVDEDELAFAIDTSSPSSLPLVCWRDGQVEAVADLLDAVDREVGTFLLELDPSSHEQAVQPSGREQHLAGLLDRIAARWPEAARLGGGYYQRQWCLLLLDRAALQNGGSPASGAHDCLRQALEHYCRSLELGTGSDPVEILEFFGLAHSVGDRAVARFLASAPPGVWDDGTLEANQTRLAFCLYKRNFEIAALLVDEAAGMLAEQAASASTSAMQRCLEDLFRKDQAAFRHSSGVLREMLPTMPRTPWDALPPSFRIAALSAVAAASGW